MSRCRRTSRGEVRSEDAYRTRYVLRRPSKNLTFRNRLSDGNRAAVQVGIETRERGTVNRMFDHDVIAVCAFILGYDDFTGRCRIDRCAFRCAVIDAVMERVTIHATGFSIIGPLVGVMKSLEAFVAPSDEFVRLVTVYFLIYVEETYTFLNHREFLSGFPYVLNIYMCPLYRDL